MKHPQILIKAREKIEDHSLSPKHVKEKEEATSSKEVLATTESNVQLFHTAKQMHKAIKLLDDGILYYDSLQDYTNDTSDFLVIGVIGTQGVGKSTVMNMLATEKFHTVNKSQNGCSEAKASEKGQHCIFKLETADDYENCSHTTNGIDMYITENRTILLDCQPFLSSSVMDELAHNDLKRSNLLSTAEHFGELQGLQHIAFLMSVCHIIIFTQDFFIDPNSVRFLLTAEMLKPTMTNNEEEFLEQCPHLLILHTKAPLEDFTQARFKQIQHTYRNIFKSSKFLLESSLGLGTGKIIPTLNEEKCGAAINLFLLPDFDSYEESICHGYPPLEQLVKTLRRNLSCVTKFPLSHVPLTEKTWLSYCTKVWDHVKKSSFYVEYAKVLP
ncbi:nonsense-mediated mRNA decay factor SMG9 isoform X2 [Atheta coriaria]